MALCCIAGLLFLVWKKYKENSNNMNKIFNFKQLNVTFYSFNLQINIQRANTSHDKIKMILPGNYTGYNTCFISDVNGTLVVLEIMVNCCCFLSLSLSGLQSFGIFHSF